MLKRSLLFLLLLLSASTVSAEPLPVWRQVVAFGRGSIHYTETRNGLILAATYNDAWLYDAQTLKDVARIEIMQARFSPDGNYIYGWRYSKPYEPSAVERLLPSMIPVAYDIVLRAEIPIEQIPFTYDRLGERSQYPREKINQLPAEILSQHQSVYMVNAYFNSSGDWLVVPSIDGLFIWNTHSGQMQRLMGLTYPIAWRPNSTQFVVGVLEPETGNEQRGAKRLQLWDAATGRLLKEVSYDFPIVDLFWEGDVLVTKHGESEDVRAGHVSEWYWDTDTNSLSPMPYPQFLCHASEPGIFDTVLRLEDQVLEAVETCGRGHGSGCRLVVEVVCGRNTGERLLDIPLGPSGISAFRWNSNGSALSILDKRGYFVAGLDGTFREFSDYPSWHPDGSEFLLSFDHTPQPITIIDAVTFEPRLTLNQAFRSARWSIGGRWISAYKMSDMQRQFILDAQTGEETLQFWSHSQYGGLMWGSDDVLLNYRTLLNTYEINVWRLEGT